MSSRYQSPVLLVGSPCGEEEQDAIIIDSVVARLVQNERAGGASSDGQWLPELLTDDFSFHLHQIGLRLRASRDFVSGS